MRMTENEALWYGAECGIRDALGHCVASASLWAKPAEFISPKAYCAFVEEYYKTYRETRERMLNEEIESDS